MKAENFVHLHLHSEYSLLDGAIRISEIPKLAKENGHTAVALTDHGNMFGAVAFYKACRREGIHPVIGCEVYVAPASRFQKEHGRDGGSYHLILLCENETGYRNLIDMVSRSYTEGFYHKPRIDMELLEQKSEGLIALSACVGGYIPQHILKGDYDSARVYASKLSEIFGPEHFYLELQDHALEDQRIVNEALVRMADDLSLPLVATNDAHYARRADADTQATLMCIQMNRTMAEGRPLGFETDEFYYKSTEEMERLFGRYPEALENTAKIAARCRFDFQFDHLYLPVYKTPDGSAPEAYLRSLAQQGLEDKIQSGAIRFDGGHSEEEYRARMEYELRMISEMGYAEYYLIVWDFVSYAHRSRIPTGPGRGSGAGSLVAYLLNITEIDSIRYQLMFERFLNPERVSMPDFDVDFCYERRGEVIDYVTQRYGADHVAQIVTFGTLAARAAVRDVGRALGYPYAMVDEVARAVPHELNMTLDKALEGKELSAMYESDEDTRRLIDTARALEGMPRHTSTHAAGVVITDQPVSSYVPLLENGGALVTQYDMDTVAELGLLKIDFLGLRYLTIIADTEKQIRETSPEFDITEVPLDDRRTYDMISQGKTEGVFQLESSGMRQMLTSLRPDNLEMIVAAIALYRPGPMDSIPRFLENRTHPDHVTYRTPLVKDILDVTFGCVVYQEQVMQIFRRVAGYSLGRADIVRRAMSKKKSEVMAREREYFIHGLTDETGTEICRGAVKNGLREEDAAALFDDMANFAKYAFNKSHAVAYAYLSYRTAYLKCHFPSQYLASLLTSVQGNLAKTAEYIAEASRLGIRIMAPDINESGLYFHVSPQRGGGRAIRFGLLAVKNIGRSFAEKLIEERRIRPFSSFENFVERMAGQELNKRQIEALIKCGAFDSLGVYRSKLCAAYEAIIDSYAARVRSNLAGQMDLFATAAAESPVSRTGADLSAGSFPYPDIPEFSKRDRLLMEHEATGQYFSGHLLDDYDNQLKAIGAVPVYDILNSFAGEQDVKGVQENTKAQPDGIPTPVGGVEENQLPEPTYKEKQRVTVAGLITRRSNKTTKNGATMAFLSMEDRYAEIEVIVFPKVLDSCSAFLLQGAVIAVYGEISMREEEQPKLLALRITPLKPDAEAEAAGEKTSSLQFKIQSSRTKQEKASGKPRTLYLRVPSTAEDDLLYRRARNLVQIFDGMLPCVFYDSDAKKYLREQALGVDASPYVVAQLRELLGDENVVLK